MFSSMRLYRQTLGRLALTWLALLGLEARAQSMEPKTVIMQKALSLNMTKLEYLDNGVYGKLGTSVMYFVHKTQLKDLDTLYGTMVRVLSVKYGCFMKARSKGDHNYGFRCRDGRFIVFRHGQAGDTYYFAGRQYDRGGDEIVINTPADSLSTPDGYN